jgi:prolyl oligopeptidase
VTSPGTDLLARLPYPPAEPRPKEIRIGSVQFEDPFAWLEEETAEALSWQAAQDAFAASWLEAREGGAALRKRIAALVAGDDVVAPQYAGGLWFRQRVPEGEDLAVLEVSETPVGPGRRIVDLNALRTGAPLNVSWFVPSPDGRRLAYARTADGGGPELFQVVDVETGELLLTSLPQERATSPAWSPDGGGFYYRAIDPALAGSRSLVFRHDLGRSPSRVPEPLELSQPISWPASSGDGRCILVYSDHMAPRPEYIREGDGPWRPFLRGVRGTFRGVVVRDRFVAITDDGASRGRVVSIPLGSPADRRSWRELVPGSDAVLASLALVGERLVLVELVDTYARLRVLRADGAVEGEIPLPGRGVVNTTTANPVAIAFIDCLVPGRGDELVFVHSTLTEAPALYQADAARRTCEPLARPVARLDAVVTDLAARSADGSEVRYRVVAPRDARAPGARPTVIQAYGGFNAALLPGWPQPALAAWVEAGGTLVVAHVRGGGELGPEWWRDGTLEGRPRSFEDLYAVAGDVVSRGIAHPGRLAVCGASSGGTLAAVAAVKKPGLFRAVVSRLPVTDSFALVRDPITYMIARVEDGDPADPAMSRVLLSWSPCQNVVAGTAYPAVLLDCGESDPRCPAWHGRKLAALLQGASSSGRPVLLRVRRSSGHRAVGESARVAQQVETFTFLAGELGLPAGAARETGHDSPET